MSGSDKYSVFPTCGLIKGFPGGPSGKEPTRQYRRCWFDPWVRKILWRKWQPLQYSCLENPMDRGAWWATIHGFTKGMDTTDCSVTKSCPAFVTPRTSAHQVPLSFTISSNSLFHSNSCPLIGDAIQPSHPLSPSSPPALSLPQHQGLFQRVSYSHQMAKVLELQLQHKSFRRIFRVDFL